MKVSLKAYLILSYLIVLFVVDIFNKVQVDVQNTFLIGIKTIKTVFLVVFSIVLLKEKNYKPFHKLGFLALLFILGQGTLMIKEYDFMLSCLPGAVRDLSLYCFPIVFISFLNTINEAKTIDRLALLFEVLIVLVVVSTLLGFMFSINFLSTYNQYRFGYLGLLPKSITATYFYISALVYTNYNISNNLKMKVLFGTTLLASLLVGTKGIYLFIPMLLSYNVIKHKYYLNRKFYFIVVPVVVALVCFQRLIFAFLQEKFVIIYSLYQQEGFLTSFMSLRDKIFFTNVEKYKHYWEWYNILIGGRISAFTLFEMSIVDLFVFFGFIGMIYYLKTIYSLMMNKMVKPSQFYVFSLSSIFFVSIFAGQFFINISAISYVIVAFYIIRQDKLKVKYDEQKSY